MAQIMMRSAILDWEEKMIALEKLPPEKKKRRTIHGCTIMLLTYIVDNMLLPEKKEKEEDSKTCPRINQYNIKFLLDKIAGAKRCRNGKVTYDKFKLKPIEHTCYDESTRYCNDSSSEMDSLLSRGMSTGMSTVDCTSRSLPTVAEVDLPVIENLKGLLTDMKTFAPDDDFKSRVSSCLISLKEVTVLKSKAAACLTKVSEVTEVRKFPQVDKLYHEHVISKINSYDRNKTVLDINNHTIQEDIFVDAFQPEGQMSSFILHTQCSIWNHQYHDHIYLKQESVTELVGGTSKNLALQLNQKTIKTAKLIFVPIYHESHFSLIVVNIGQSFDWLDSLPDIAKSHVEQVVANLHTYLAKLGICARKWPLSQLPVKTQKNTYDCGYRLMLHMIYYGKDDVYEIDEDMVFRYRKKLAVDLLYHPANKKKPCPRDQVLTSPEK
ncbi:uncharacterized protein [Miscanthus floridulus]|uniref:uncharacterized protein isoform X2 n=1 Tax=Miscanthus floridulus TaxID=154761 RepID=UPI0034583DDD